MFQADVPDLPRPMRALFGWLGFRYLHLRLSGEAESHAVVPTVEMALIGREAVPA